MAKIEIKRLHPDHLSRLKATGKRYKVRFANNDFPGLILTVLPDGRINFSFRYQLQKRRREMSIGFWPESNIPALRTRYEAAWQSVRDGIDPIKQKTEEERQKKLEEITEPFIIDLVDDYLETKTRDLKAITLKGYRRIFEKYVFVPWPNVPDFTEIKINELRRRDIKILIDYIANKKPNTHKCGSKGRPTRGAPAMANRVLAAISGFCQYAVDLEYIDVNPAHGLKKPGRRNTRERWLTMAEIGTVGRVLNDEAPRLIRDSVYLALYSGQRLAQIAGLKLSWIKEGWLEFPAAIMKSGKPHRIPLTPQIKALIDARVKEKLTRKGYLFPGEKDNPHAHPQALKRGLARLFTNPERLKRMKKRKRWPVVAVSTPPLTAAGVDRFSFHDCRRTIATHLNRLGFYGLDKIVLGHAAAGVTDVFYQRYRFDDELKKALKVWGTAIDSAVSGQDQEKIIHVDFT